MEIRREIFCDGRRYGVYKLKYNHGYFWSYIPTVEDAPQLIIKDRSIGFSFTIPFEESDLGDFEKSLL